MRGVDFDFFEENNIGKYYTLGYTCIVGDWNSKTGLLSYIFEYNKHLDVCNKVNFNFIWTTFRHLGHFPKRMNEDLQLIVNAGH